MVDGTCGRFTKNHLLAMGRGREGVRDPLKHAASSYTVLVQHGKDIRVVA